MYHPAEAGILYKATVKHHLVISTSGLFNFNFIIPGIEVLLTIKILVGLTYHPISLMNAFAPRYRR